MSGWKSQFLWSFPGGETSLLLCLVAGLVIITLSYYFTLRKLPRSAKILLSILRFMFLIALIACLCNPRIERTRTENKREIQKLAIVFDNSSSMNIKGFWKKTRLEDALDFWNFKVRGKGPAIVCNYYSFDEQLKRLSRPEALSSNEAEIPVGKRTAGDKRPPSRKTFLHGNIAQWCSELSLEEYDGVICFTDGIDTSDKREDIAMKKLASTGLRHIFIPVVTELPTHPEAVLKRVESVTRARVDENVNVTAVVQFSNIVNSQSMTLELKNSQGIIIAQKELVHKESSGTIITQFKLPPASPGTVRYSMELVCGHKTYGAAEWTLTRFIPRKERKVLVYQGALDWGTRFLKYAFADQVYDLDIRFAPSVFNRNLKGKDSSFPTFDKLNEYDALILLNLNREQIDAGMEATIRKFVTEGGGVLFITGNPMIAREFANSAIEKLLPVKFSPTCNVAKRYDSKTKHFLEQIKRRGKRFNRRLGEVYWRRQEYKLKVPPLMDFSLTSEGKASPLFRDQDSGQPLIPKFQDYAFVSGIKPGASSLAYYVDGKGRKNVLMAVQRFGFGRSAVMVTDPLWRWKLSYPSIHRYYELFWKNLVSWLGAGRQKSCQWVLPSMLLPKGVPVEIFFDTDGASNASKNLNFYMLKGSKRYQLNMLPTMQKGRLKVEITPETGDSTIELVAERHGNGKNEVVASALFTVTGEVQDIEYTMLKPNVGVLRRFASLPTVWLIDMNRAKTDISTWFQPEKSSYIRKETEALWHREWVFALMLVFFILEMITRRFFKLV